ncbi:ferredoxin, partial [Mobiluncus curtisii]
APAGSGTPFRYELEKIAQCTDCKTCYQEIPEYFEASTEIIDGKPTPVARLIPGSLENVKVTDELRARIAKVVANCDAEIIS